MATASLVRNGLRVTLALRLGWPDDDTVSVLATLRQRVKAQGIRGSGLVLDKGVESSAVLEYLPRPGQAALIACPIRGTTGGTRALCQGHKSYGTTPTFKGPQGGEFTSSLLVCRGFTTARRTGRHVRQADWLVFVQLPLALSPRYARPR